MLKTVPLMLALLVQTACSDGCANEVLSQAGAPDGRHKAVLFQRDCGATTSFSTQVSVLNDAEELSGSGNTFIADDDHGAARAGAWGGPWADMKWVGPRQVLVRYSTGSRFFKRESEVSGVRIAYEPDRR
jgi:hypothetical protein